MLLETPNAFEAEDRRRRRLGSSKVTQAETPKNNFGRYLDGCCREKEVDFVQGGKRLGSEKAAVLVRFLSRASDRVEEEILLLGP